MANIETQVMDWATEAADAFLNRKVGMNESIGKIASRESLNREKVARVVEEANKQVFLKMFEKNADKCFTFDVADVNRIVGEEPPLEIAMGSISDGEKNTAKTASDLLFERALNGSGTQQAWDVMEKAILAREMLAEKAAMSKEGLMQAQTAFCKIAQQMVLQEDYTFPEIFEALSSVRPQHWKKIAFLLKVAAVHMGKKFEVPEMEKRAGEAVDPGEYDVLTKVTASGMPVEVINGSHKIVVTLDTLIDQTTEHEKANKNLWSADDTVKYLRREIRNYLATHRHV